jgi:hypothetical protein
MNVGVAVRVHSRSGDDLGLCHVAPPVELGDVLELGHGPILLLRVVDVVEAGPSSPLAALVKVAPAPLLAARWRRQREERRRAGSQTVTALRLHFLFGCQRSRSALVSRYTVEPSSCADTVE